MVSRPPQVVRSVVAAKSSYGDYREQLRADFVYACAYCAMSELEAVGIGFAIDHYQPQEMGGTDDYDNLYWSCQKCNRTKSSYWPKPTTPAYARVIQVDLEDPDVHFDLDPRAPDQLVEKTDRGRFNIELLRLNSSVMRKLRKLRRDALHAESAIRLGLRTLAKMRVDDLPPELKAKALAIRNQLNGSAATSEDLYDQTMRTLAETATRSELLDEDSAPEERKQRKAYLQKIGVMKKPIERRNR